MVAKKDASKKKSTKDVDYEAKIRALEKRIDSLEKAEKAEEPEIVSGMVGQFIPGLGGIVKMLEKTSPEFRKKIAETDTEIKHRLESGWSSKPKVESSFSVKPLAKGPIGMRPGAGRAAVKPVERRITAPSKVPEREPIIDIFEEKEHISVIAEIPGLKEEDIEVKLEESRLIIKAGKYSKVIDLPSPPKKIIEKTYRNGILHLSIKRK